MLHHKVVAELMGSDLLCAHEFDVSCDTCRMRAIMEELAGLVMAAALAAPAVAPGSAQWQLYGGEIC